MSADRLLATVLRGLQSAQSAGDTPRLLSIAASLLTSLQNPLNVTLLTSQILSAPLLWDRPDGLRTCFRVLGVFSSASVAILSNAETRHTIVPGGARALSPEKWIKAVVNGADSSSPRWRHLLAIGGLLVGFEGHGRAGLSERLRVDLSEAVVKIVNITLSETRGSNGLDTLCLPLVLNHIFELLPEAQLGGLNYDALLPVLVSSAFHSSEGFGSGYFVGALDGDVIQAGNTFNWSARSATFQQLQQISTAPLVASMGPLSRLIAHAIEHVRSPEAVLKVVKDLLYFSRNLSTQWRRGKLSEIDVSEESVFLHPETLRATIPVLWQVLKAIMFASVVIQRAILGRTLKDANLADGKRAAGLAMDTLHTLRGLYFISSRLGSNAFTTYTFVYMTAIDILSNFRSAAQQFLVEIKPREIGQIPAHPLDRCMDLYFLNTCEQFTMTVTPAVNEDLIVAASVPYLSPSGHPNMLEIFEAAHSVLLAVFLAPQNADIAARTLPFYVDTIFKSFPETLSARQFRLAYKTLLKVSSPPSLISATQPDLAATLLEILRHNALHASPVILPTPGPARQPPSNLPSGQRPAGPDPALQESEEQTALPSLSPQATHTLALLDSLPFISPLLLDEWLPLAADLINSNGDPSMATVCRDRLWEVLSSGEMDVERSEICVAWWGTRGGRELVLSGPPPLVTSTATKESPTQQMQ